VIGGGISGLAAAHRLRELDTSCQIELFETGTRLGGSLETIQEEGFQVEQGADHFTTTAPWVVDLCHRIGIEDQLVPSDLGHREICVGCGDRLHKLPTAYLEAAFTSMWLAATGPILSRWGRMRAAIEPFIPPRGEGGDESVASFARRRFGYEVFERLVQPLVTGLYAADAEKLSVEALFSRWAQMERDRGGRLGTVGNATAAVEDLPSDFHCMLGESERLTLRHGLSSLAQAIADRLPDGVVRLNTRVSQIQPSPDGRWMVWFEGGLREAFDGVILATPAYEAARLLRPVDRRIGARLAKVAYAGVTVVSLAFNQDQIGHSMEGRGFVLPAIENSPIFSCEFSSCQFPHRAPAGKVLLRALAGGACHPEVLRRDESDLEREVVREISQRLNIHGQPIYLRTVRSPNRMPQYDVGHHDLIAEVESRVARLPSIALAGNAYHGLGIAECIHGGEKAALRVLMAVDRAIHRSAAESVNTVSMRHAA
jgi:oxygen-dependent protoporphyrinogen oxidase